VVTVVTITTVSIQMLVLDTVQAVVVAVQIKVAP